MRHLHLHTGITDIGTVWVDADGRVQDDGTPAARDAIEGMNHKLGREHGEALLKEIERRLDRATLIGTRWCDDPSCLEAHDMHWHRLDHEDRHSTEPTPTDRWPDHGEKPEDERHHHDIQFGNDVRV